jgi:hypothetical protein
MVGLTTRCCTLAGPWLDDGSRPLFDQLFSLARVWDQGLTFCFRMPNFGTMV